MEGNLPHTDDLFTPGRHGDGDSAHFGTAQDGTVIQWVPLGVVVDTRDGHPVTKLDLNNASAHVVTVPTPSTHSSPIA